MIQVQWVEEQVFWEMLLKKKVHKDFLLFIENMKLKSNKAAVGRFYCGKKDCWRLKIIVETEGIESCRAKKGNFI